MGSDTPASPASNSNAKALSVLFVCLGNICTTALNHPNQNKG